MSKNHYNNLWVEKYRPQKLSEIILSQEHREYFSKIGEDIPHILFYGSPGIGKTTLAKIIVNDILKCQYLYINASDENGIDTIRNKVTLFSQTRSLDGKKKIVILDEADGLTGDSLRILRNVMDSYTDTTRFVLTANYLSRIIEPVRSRCAMFKLMPEIVDYVGLCTNILKSEGIKVNSGETKSKFVEFLTDRFPDMRRILNDLQKYSVNGELIFPDENNITNLVGYIVKGIAITKLSSLEIRKTVIEAEKTFSNDYQSLMKDMFDYVYDSTELNDKVKKSLMVEIGEHLYRDNFVLDHEINFFCCVLAMENTLT